MVQVYIPSPIRGNPGRHTIGGQAVTTAIFPQKSCRGPWSPPDICGGGIHRVKGESPGTAPREPSALPLFRFPTSRQDTRISRPRDGPKAQILSPSPWHHPGGMPPFPGNKAPFRDTGIPTPPLRRAKALSYPRGRLTAPDPWDNRTARTVPAAPRVPRSGASLWGTSVFHPQPPALKGPEEDDGRRCIPCREAV